MRKWMRRIRGALGIGLTWAVGWVPVGALTGWITGIFLGAPLVTITWNYAVMFGVLGVVGGSIFSTVLSLAEGRRRFDQLSLARFAAWGALGGFLLGGLSAGIGLLGSGFGILGAVIVSVATLLGAGSAAGTLVVARVADDRALLAESEEVARAGLSPGEDPA